jgi:hypothetical protein
MMNSKVLVLLRIVLINLSYFENKKPVLKEHARAFKPLFVKTNARLQDIFGLQMVQLPNREKAASTSAAARRAQISKEKAGKIASSNAYILQNIVPGQVRLGVVNWEPKEQEWMVLLCLILSLIFVNDRVLSDGKSRETKQITFKHKANVTSNQNP